MEYKKALAILLKMLDRCALEGEEKEAVLTAVGVLDAASLGENRFKSIIKARKEKRDKGVEW